MVTAVSLIDVMMIIRMQGRNACPDPGGRQSCFQTPRPRVVALWELLTSGARGVVGFSTFLSPPTSSKGASK